VAHLADQSGGEAKHRKTADQQLVGLGEAQLAEGGRGLGLLSRRDLVGALRRSVSSDRDTRGVRSSHRQTPRASSKAATSKDANVPSWGVQPSREAGPSSAPPVS
jgi:hypothetical protein